MKWFLKIHLWLFGMLYSTVLFSQGYTVSPMVPDFTNLTAPWVVQQRIRFKT